MIHSGTMVQGGSPIRYLIPMLALLVAALCIAVVPAVRAEDGQPAVPPTPPPEFYKIEFEPDAYYTSLGLYLALTKTPIPHVGEQS